MSALPTPKPTRKSKALVRVPPTIASSCEEKMFFVYHESRKREVKTKPIYECRCDERLKTKTEKSTRLGYTGLLGELEHLKIKTRLITVVLGRVFPTFSFRVSENEVEVE
jgi:hypothetical protein